MTFVPSFEKPSSGVSEVERSQHDELLNFLFSLRKKSRLKPEADGTFVNGYLVRIFL
jgi:hypothetical protein